MKSLPMKKIAALKRIVGITFVALLSLALADTSIAETKKVKQQENQEQMKALQTFGKALQGASQVRSYPQQGTGPKGAPTASRGTAGRK
jgi:hypothetical protein